MFRPWDRQYDVKAVIDETEQYRYQFTCKWGNGRRLVTFVMLNPSQGNQSQDDRTLQRCISYAKHWGYDGIKVVNLFAYISTDPKELKGQVDAVGPENDKYVLDAAHRSERVIVAWGKKTFAQGRIDEVLELLSFVDLYAIEVTNCGRYPKHPLYLRGELSPELFRPATKEVIKLTKRTVPHQMDSSREGMIGGSDVGLFDDPDWRL